MHCWGVSVSLGNLDFFANTGFNNTVFLNEFMQISGGDPSREGKISQRKDVIWQVLHVFRSCPASACSFSPCTFSHANHGNAPVLGAMGGCKVPATQKLTEHGNNKTEQRVLTLQNRSKQHMLKNKKGQERDCTCGIGLPKGRLQ